MGLSVGITMTVVTPPAAADAAAGCKAFLVHQPRLTEVHMAVDQSGKHHFAVGIDRFTGRRRLARVENGGNPPVRDSE